MNAFMVSVQQQLSKMPEYKTLTDNAQKTADAYSAAIKAAEDSCNCKLDYATLTPTPMKAEQKPTEPKK